MRQVEFLKSLAELNRAVRAEPRVNDRRIGRISGVHHVGAAVVVSFLGIQRANDAQVMHLLGNFGQMFGDLHAGRRSRNRLERSAVLLAVRLQVPDVEMTGASSHP